MASKSPFKVKMKKVVINKCYGGFGLSAEALKLLARRCHDKEHIELLTPEQYYGATWKEDLARYQAMKNVFTPVMFGKRIICDEHRSTYGLTPASSARRECPHLVSVVEKLKSKANGAFAKLAIVKVPVDVEYTIEEYDGIEHVAATHETWR